MIMYDGENDNGVDNDNDDDYEAISALHLWKLLLACIPLVDHL